MKQFLRSLCTLLLLMMWCSVGFAQTTVTFDATKDKSSTTTLTKDGVTLKIGSGKLNNGTDFRCYSKAGFTISSDADITKIEFTCASGNGPDNITKTSTGEYAYSGDIGTWTGLTHSVKFSNTKDQVRMKKIVVTLAPSKTPTTLTFPQSTISIEEGNEATFTGQKATLKTDKTELDKAITYAYSGSEIFATFNTATGDATLKTGVYGTATVTATYAGDETYEKAVASYTVTVKNPNVFETTYDFVNNSYGYNRKDYLKEGDIISNKTPVIIINTKNGGTDTRFWDKDFRNYQNAVLTIKSDEGFIITKITMTGDNINQLNLNDGNGSWTKTKEDGVWSGSSQSISFTNPGSKQDNKVIRVFS